MSEKAVKVELYQNMVNYRREMSFGYLQTYPLPTPSMIKGMAHYLLSLKEYKPLKISIQGSYDTVITNMQNVYKFDRDRTKEGRDAPILHVFVGGKKQLIRGNMFVDLIVNIRLILHIKFEEDRLNDELISALKQHLIVLGRNEDIARVDKVKLVKVSKKELDERLPLKNNIYLTSEYSEQLIGTHFRLPFYYEPVKSFQDKRIFRFVDVVYIDKHNRSFDEFSEIFVDDDEEQQDPVCFLSIDDEKKE